jgi:LysR family transcriptional activator of nhaA
VVAREGGLVPAGRVLHLTHPTLSAQIRSLEEEIGGRLFTRVGRRLSLTETGRIVFRYADEIFTLGSEMMDTVRGRSGGRPLRFDVGVSDVVPKLVVRRLLEPALALPEPVRLVCREDDFDRLLADLALHAFDIVIADSPVPTGSSIRAFHHLLGETGITFFGSKRLADRHRRGFPRSLDGAALLLPIENLTLRRALNAWFEAKDIRPRVAGEFEDSALLKEFGAHGLGIFPAPTVIEKEITGQYAVQVVGRTDEVRERYYALSAERRLKHPAVVAILEAARQELFARSGRRPARQAARPRSK